MGERSLRLELLHSPEMFLGNNMNSLSLGVEDSVSIMTFSMFGEPEKDAAFSLPQHLSGGLNIPRRAHQDFLIQWSLVIVDPKYLRVLLLWSSRSHKR